MDNYETILARMKSKYEELTGYAVPELSDIDIRMKVLAGEIYNNEINLDFVKRQISPLTATGEYLDLHASDRGIERLAPVKARGLVKFISNTVAENNITIPAGTVVSTGGSDGSRYSTTAEVTLRIGRTEISAPCEAIEGGTAGNAAPNTVNVLVTNIVGIDRVNNLYAINGGCDGETDDHLRKRILEAYKYISNGTNAAYYRNLALSVEGVTSANVVPRARGEGTVDVYIASQREASSETLVNKVRELIGRERELNVDIQVFTASPVSFTVGVEVILKPGYSLETATQNIRNSINSFLDCLDIGESVYENHIGSAVISSEGVFDYRWIGNYQNRCEVNADDFPVLSELHVEQQVD